MRALVQRTTEASVAINGKIHAEIRNGLVVLVGFSATETDHDLLWSIKKILELRIFNDEDGKMNLSLLETGGDLLIVSQFTLLANIKKGNRPSYIEAMNPSDASLLFDKFNSLIEKEWGRTPQKGIFGADMKVSLVNDGPVTIWIDSKNP